MSSADGLREGKLRPSQLKALQDRKKAFDDPFQARTRLLHATNSDVDIINQEHLDKLGGDIHEYSMDTSGAKKYVESLKQACLAPEVLQLKKNAVIMCLKNSPNRKYVNGSLGKVIGFEKSTNYPIIQLNDGTKTVIGPDTWELRDGDEKRASLSQIPLRLAWAITVIKAKA